MRAILDENFGKDRTHLDESELIVMMVTQVFGFDRNLVMDNYILSNSS